jgi:endonuclease YncB( thermonuclease family)
MMKPWWKDRIPDPEFILILLCIVALLILLLMFVAVCSARAEACLTIDVPPQAVIHQPDGDTFHVFAFAPGGRVKIRVQGVNTPEKNQPHWAEAKAFTKVWLAQGPFKLSTCGKTTLDRIEGAVSRNGEALADALSKAGFNTPR